MAWVVQEDDIQNTVVVVSVSLSNRNFDNSVFSPTKLGPAIGDRLAREFKKPLNKAQASHIHANGNQRTKAAVMAWFDNYRIFSGHALAPLTATGTYRYDLKGQDAFTAEQRSALLGKKARKQIDQDGRNESLELIVSGVSAVSCMTYPY